MKVLRIPIGCTVVLLSALSAPALFGTASAAQDSTSDRACAVTLLHDLEDASLTREERIALLEKALLESVNNFGSCQSTATQSAITGATSGAVSGGVQGGAAADASAQSEAPAVVESAPVGDVQGDLPAAQSPDAPTVGKQETTVAGKDPSGGTLPNGKAPEDIPPAANDDIIAKQFRQAAVEETDPVAKAKLWNEYRRYKNLPVKEVPET